jgi:hypothetical protein
MLPRDELHAVLVLGLRRRGDRVDCVDATVDEITDELLCIQFATGWGPCPPDA